MAALSAHAAFRPDAEFVVDASLLVHSVLASRDDVLRGMLPDATFFVTDVVRGELLRLVGRSPSWCINHSPDLQLFTAYGRLVGLNGRHNAGEAATLAAAEELCCVAIVDDADARKVAQRHGARAHGSLWLLSGAVNLGLVDRVAVGVFCDDLGQAGMRWPFRPGDYAAWASQHGLLKGTR